MRVTIKDNEERILASKEATSFSGFTRCICYKPDYDDAPFILQFIIDFLDLLQVVLGSFSFFCRVTYFDGMYLPYQVN
jgi:hypothetical protein